MTLTDYAASKGHTVMVLSKPTCQQCVATKKWLTKNGIPFGEGYVLDDDVLPLVQEAGIQSAPVVISKAGVWGGFRPDMLEKIK